MYDYSKIVEFIYGKKEDKLNDVLKYLLSNDYLMLDVHIQNKVILLEKNKNKYVMLKKDNRILILPINFNSVCLTEEFGELTEICINQDGYVIISKIFNTEAPKGVGAYTSAWRYESNLYNEVVGRVMFIKQEKIEVIENQESLEMFINKYYDLRNDILNDLYWDLTLFAKNNFLDVNLSQRIMASDAFNTDKFDVLYKKHREESLKLIAEKGKSSLF